MSNRTYNAEIVQGESWKIVVEYRDDDNAPIDLTGYTAKLAARKAPSASVALSLTSAAGITIDAENGSLTVVATSAQTAAMKPNTYQYELRIVSGSEEDVLIEGNLRVKPAIAV